MAHTTNDLRSSLSALKGEICYLYLVENHKQQCVLDTINEKHGVNYTHKQLRKRLEEWGYYKYDKKETHLKVLALREHHKRQFGNQKFEYFLNGRRINLDRAERFRKTKKISSSDLLDENNSAALFQDIRVHPFVFLPASMTLPDAMEAQRQIVQNSHTLIRDAFRKGVWKFYDNERLIESSETCKAEKQSLMIFLKEIDLGLTAARRGRRDLAFIHWEDASKQLDGLVKGQYHDILPNIFHKINNLTEEKFHEVAGVFLIHITDVAKQHQKSDPLFVSVFQHFAKLAPHDLIGLEEEMGRIYSGHFDYWVGDHCYNTFVMNLNATRRRLDRNNSEKIDELLPDRAKLDEIWGPANCRSLDVIRHRMEVHYQRGLWEDVLPDAKLLIDRASTKDDRWQRPYFLIKALFHRGSSLFYMGQGSSAKFWLDLALDYLAEFREIESDGQFDGTEILIQEKLQVLRDAGLVGMVGCITRADFANVV